MIDHEQWNIKVLLSSSTFYVLLQDMHRFSFFKNNKEINTNAFINKILPFLFYYREERSKNYAELLEANNIPKKYFNELFDINDIFNYSDDKTSYHDEKISVRISKRNIDIFKSIFGDIDDVIFKKSNFIRLLLNQYTMFKLDEREIICFYDEYKLISEAIENGLYLKKDNKEIFPVTITTCPFNSEIYVISLMKTNDKMYLVSNRLCDLKSVTIVKNKTKLALDNATKKDINEYIYGIEYADKAIKEIGE